MILFLGRYLIGVLECHQTGKKRYSCLAIIRCAVPVAIVAQKIFMRRKTFLYPNCTVSIMTGKKRSITTGKKRYSRLSVVSRLAIIRCAVPIASAQLLLQPEKKF
jgi:hypothetical protein